MTCGMEMFEGLCRQEGIEGKEVGLIKEILDPMESYHRSTYEHSLRVGTMAAKIAKVVDSDPRLAIYGVWHDMGKLEIPIDLLDSMNFSREDMTIMKRHTTEGYKILFEKGYTFAAGIALFHHLFQKESYPVLNGGIAKENGTTIALPYSEQEIKQILDYSEIVSIADKDDALKRENNRHGQKRLSLEERKSCLIREHSKRKSLIECLYEKGVLN